MSRGNAKQPIFLDDRDRRLFLDLLGECVTRFDWILYAYALMPNHFHLLVQLTAETLSHGMQWLNGSYAIAFNERHERVGHLLQGRFKSPLVEKERYLLQLIRYIVLNPVRAGMVKLPEDHRWTSYRATVGVAPAPRWLAVDDVLLPFGPDRGLARAAFRDFVNAAIGIDAGAWKELVGRSYIGSDEWLATVNDRIKLQPRSTEHPLEQRAMAGEMSAVIAAVADTCRVDRALVHSGIERTPRMLAAWIAWKYANLSGAKIAADLNLSSARISQLVRRCERELEGSPALRELASTVCRKFNI